MSASYFTEIPSPFGHPVAESSQEEEATIGMVNLYGNLPRPEEWFCWPTLEEAKANNLTGGFARYWKVAGTRRRPGIGGTSFMLSVQTVEWCKVEASPGKRS